MFYPLLLYYFQLQTPKEDPSKLKAQLPRAGKEINAEVFI